MANNFDFKPLNDILRTMPAGLKLAVARNMLKDVKISFARFDNPLESDITQAISILDEVREESKRQAAERAAKTGKLMASDGQSE